MASLEDIGKLFDTKPQAMIQKMEVRVEKNETRTQEAHHRIDQHEQRLVDLETKASSGASNEAFPAPRRRRLRRGFEESSRRLSKTNLARCI